MIDIYICEDNLTELALFTKYITNIVMFEELDMQLVLASSNPHELLNQLPHSTNIGLFFLDIDLHSDIDGLTLAQEIRALQPNCFIVFITSHSEMSFLTFKYKVEALDFIIKNDIQTLKTQIHECLLYAIQKYASLNNKAIRTFIVPFDGRKIIIDYNDIILFEASPTPHKVILYGKKRRIEFPSHLKEIEQKLEHPFFRCHRSYIVNLNQIQEVDFQLGIITMVTGQTCPVSLRIKPLLRKKLSNIKHKLGI